MKVKELIEQLQELPEDMFILLPYEPDWNVRKTTLKYVKTMGHYIHPSSYKHVPDFDYDDDKDIEVVVLF